MKIVLEEGCLVVGGSRGGNVRFADIVEGAAEKVGKITYDEVFLIVRQQSGEGVTLGELDEGFAEAEEARRVHLPGFPSDWRAAAEEAPIGLRSQLWAAPG